MVSRTERPTSVTDNYDLVVIGGGSAGLAAARTAKSRDARVLLISDGPIGGECTFTGCVPSKTLIEAAQRGESFDSAIRAVRTAVAAIAATESADVLRAEGIEVTLGRARFESPTELAAGERRVRARRFVLATGSRPALPPVSDLRSARHLTNETVFGLTDLPARLIVLGGGAVGCELAQAMARFGSAVTLVEACDRVLPQADGEAARVAGHALRQTGVDLRLNTTARQVLPDGDDVGLRLSDGDLLVADHLLVATGRRAATEDCGLDAAGVGLDKRGAVLVDRRLRTTTRGIYAAGDVTGTMPFTHAAFAMGQIAAGNALRGRLSPARSFRTEAIGWTVFTEPEIAQVGVSEPEAAARYPDARVAYWPMTRTDRAVAAGRTEGFVKIIAVRRPVLGWAGGGRVLGATVVAERAGEMIGELALAVRTGMFTGRLAQLTHPYPTWSVAIQQAAAQFFGGGYGGRTPRRPVG